MNQVTYKICEEKTENNETSYGIIAYKKITEIKNISSDYDKLNQLVQACNQHELDPIHLKDVVSDFLYDLDL